MEKVVIWGAGVKGEAVFSLIDKSTGGNYDVICFIDNNPDLTGTSLCSKTVHSSDILLELDVNTRILIASKGFISIITELHLFREHRNYIDAVKHIMLHKYSQQFPLCIKHIWESKRTFSSTEDGREDLIVEAVFRSIGIETPIYCDIGARNTTTANNTYLFYLKGASGMAVDPLPTYVNEWAEVRPRDVFLNIALANTTQANVPFYVVAGTGSSTLNGIRYQADVRKMKYETIYVDQDVFNNIADKNVQWVDIDVDGLDMEILASIDFKLFPQLVVVSIERTDSKCIDYMTRQGFSHFLTNSLNSIFIHNTIVENVFNCKLCSEIYFWHKLWLLIQDKSTFDLPL